MSSTPQPAADRPVRPLDRITRRLLCAALLAAAAAAAAAGATAPALAWDWGWGLGVHDFVVPEESSHTFGANGTLSVDHKTSRGLVFTGAADVLVDIDKDDLDPDHIPIWFRSDYRLTYPLAKLGEATTFEAVADLNGKRNTVSSVEVQIKAFPGLALVHTGRGGAWHAGVQLAAGWYSLEIDDDVPKTRGYDRGDLSNDVLAWAARLDGGVQLGATKVYGAVQHWGDGDGTLEDQARLELSWDASGWRKDSRLVLFAEYTRYNLDPYHEEAPLDEAGAIVPILPWDHDVYVRFSFQTRW